MRAVGCLHNLSRSLVLAALVALTVNVAFTRGILRGDETQKLSDELNQARQHLQTLDEGSAEHRAAKVCLAKQHTTVTNNNNNNNNNNHNSNQNNSHTTAWIHKLSPKVIHPIQLARLCASVVVVVGGWWLAKKCCGADPKNSPKAALSA